MTTTPITLLFSTVDIEPSAGRARIMAEIAAAVAPLGLSDVFTGITTDLKWPGGSAPSVPPLAAQAPVLVPLGDDLLVLDVADLVLARQTGTTTVDINGQTQEVPVLTQYGYIANVSLRLRMKPEHITPLLGTISSHWTSTPAVQETPAAWMLDLDPGRGDLSFHERNSVRFWDSIRARKLL